MNRIVVDIVVVAMVVLDMAEYVHTVAGGMACLAVLDCCLETETAVEEDILLAVIATVMEWRNAKEELFLFNR